MAMPDAGPTSTSRFSVTVAGTGYGGNRSVVERCCVRTGVLTNTESNLSISNSHNGLFIVGSDITNLHVLRAKCQRGRLIAVGSVHGVPCADSFKGGIGHGIAPSSNNQRSPSAGLMVAVYCVSSSVCLIEVRP